MPLTKTRPSKFRDIGSRISTALVSKLKMGRVDTDHCQPSSKETTTDVSPASGAESSVQNSPLAAAVAEVPYWFHSIDLGQGVVTPGLKTTDIHSREVLNLQLPDLRDKSVLDIGAWDGFYSFEAERRGAQRVVSLDHFVWSLDRHQAKQYQLDCVSQGITPKPFLEMPGVWRPDTLPGKAGYDCAHRALGSKAESVAGDFMEMDLSSLGTFDVVLYLGVLYHMRHPLLALERVAQVTKGMAVIETHAIHVPGHEKDSLCEFYETTELNNDPTNWWGFNAEAFVKLCRAAGFRRAEVTNTPPQRGKDIRHYRLHAHAWK